MPTLYDVAKLAGVSPKTVSRVLNEPHLVTEETRERVNLAIKKLDYHPNAIAASLKRQRTNIIGFVIPYGSDFVYQDPNMMEQLRGVHNLLNREGYGILISAPIYKKDALNEVVRLIKRKNVDGVILYPSAGVERIIMEFNEKKFSYVSLGLCFAEQQTNFVDINLTPGAYAATKYLISQGHHQIGLVNKPHDFFIYSKEDLLRGYQLALQDAGISYRKELVYEGDFTFDGGYQAFQKLKMANPNLSAVISASDPMTYGVIKAVTDAGLVPNQDITIVSGDNLPFTRKIYPSISSISNPAFEQGKEAGKMITAIINSGLEVPGVMLDTDFVIHGMA